jgi:predicted nucleic acid-binding protein
LCWYFEGQKTSYTEGVLERLVLGDEILVPAVWPLEIVNSLVIAVRQKGITSAQLETFVADLKDLPLEVDLQGVARAYSSILRISRQYQLSSYDAAYLDLALFEGLPLATVDKNLRAAAKRSGAELFDPREPRG